MIYTNPSNGVREVSGVYYNPGNGVKTVQAVWENVGGHLYQIYPVAHTAYNGSTFSGALNGGLRSGIGYYCSLYVPNTGTVASVKKIYRISTGYLMGYPENETITSGGAHFGCSESSRDNPYTHYNGFISVNLVNLALYETIIVKTHVDDSSFIRIGGVSLRLCLTNEAGNDTTTISVASESEDGSDRTYTFNISSLTDRRYIGFIFHEIPRPTESLYDKYYNAHITQIRFE